MDSTVIELTERHRSAAVATLAVAFENDPAVSWIMPDPADRARRLPKMFDWLFDDHLRHGMMLGTPDCTAVTFWRLPGKVHHHDALWPPHLLHLLTIFGSAIFRAAKVGDAIEAHLPLDEDWLYLRYAGVLPSSQGKGLGGKVIRAGLVKAAQRGVGALLETATPVNVGIYLRLGFTVLHEWDVGAQAPHFWTMIYSGDVSGG